MLTLARHVSLVLDFEGLHGTSHIQVRHGLDRIPDPNVGYVRLGLIRWSNFSGQRSKMYDVKLVADKFIHDQRMVLGVMETEVDGIAPTNWLAQFKNEESRGIR